MSDLDRVKSVLESSYDRSLADATVDAFAEIERQYALGNWKASELDSGHFVEAVRRILEFETEGKYTPIGDNLGGFHAGALGKLESATQCNDSIRFLIPKVLYAIYGVRNKRGVAHLGVVSANEMDSTLILFNVKWVVAELVRMKSSLSPSETQSLVEAIVERDISLLWKTNDFVRVLDPDLPTESQILILLYDGDKDNSALYKGMPDVNPRSIRRSLEQMNKDRKIAYSKGESSTLSPVGRLLAERVIEEHQFTL